jgi:Peptidase_C39 like family
MARDFARGEYISRNQNPYRNNLSWDNNESQSLNLSQSRSNKEENWLTIRENKRKQKAKEFRPLPPHLQSSEAIEAYINSRVHGAETDESSNSASTLAAAQNLAPSSSDQQSLENNNTAQSIAAAPQQQQSGQGQQPQKVAQASPQSERSWLNSGIAAKGGLETIPFDGRIVRKNKEGKQVIIPVKFGQKFQMQPGDQLQYPMVTDPGKQKTANAPSQAAPVDTFKDKLKNNALKRLQDNSNRLNSELKDYQNLSPNNPKWQQLRQMASKDQQFVQRDQQLNHQIADLVMKDRKETSFTPPNTFIDRDDVAHLGVINPQIQAQIKELEGQQALLKIARRQMQAQHPALAVVDSAKVASSSNQELLGNINQGFGQIQGNIGDLQKQIQADPSKALFLDDVVKGTLGGLKIDPNNPNQTQTGKAITDWLKGEQTKHNLVKWGGTLLTGGLTVGAIITTFASEGLALPFWLGLGGAITGLGTAAYDYRELATVDLAAQAQQGGAGNLTSQDKDTARFNLMMGRVNLLMSGLDVGLSVKAVTGLLTGAKSAEQMSTFAKAMKAQEAGQTEEALTALKPLRKELGEEAYQELERTFGGQLEPGNPNSTSLPRNGKRKVLNQMDAPVHGEVACGPTSCGMVMNDRGKPLDLGALSRQSGLNPMKGGTSIDKLASTLRQNGIKDARWVRQVSLDDLTKATSHGKPAIVYLKLDRGGHFVIVDGVTMRQGQKVVAVRDPAGGRKYFTPIEEFSEKFRGGEAIFTNPIQKTTK